MAKELRTVFIWFAIVEAVVIGVFIWKLVF